jgi:hypothetical protein
MTKAQLLAAKQRTRNYVRKMQRIRNQNSQSKK